MTLKHIPLLVCALAALSAAAGAQFTAAVVPPRAKAKTDTTIKKDSVRRATLALAARVTDMKRWVDSAAGVSLPASDSAAPAASGSDSTTPPVKDSAMISRNQRVREDSAASIATVEVHDTSLKDTATAPAVPPTSARPSKGETTKFANGAPAPATASALPLLLLVGVSTLLAGAALRRA